MFILKKNSLEEAARKVKVIFSIPENEGTICRRFPQLGFVFAAIERTKEGYSVSVRTKKALAAEGTFGDLVEATKSEYTARLFVSSKVREYAFAYLGDDEKSQIVDALMNFDKDSEKAVQLVGKAFETFLRRLGTYKGVEGLAKAHGIAELANYLKN